MKKIVVLLLVLLVLSGSSYAQGTGIVTKVTPAVQALTRRSIIKAAPFRAVPKPPAGNFVPTSVLQALNADVTAGTQNTAWKTALQILQSPTRNLTADRVVQTLEKLASSTLEEALEQTALFPDDLHLPMHYEPTEHFTIWGFSPFNTKEVYPQYTFLTVGNEETRNLAVGHYISAANNRRYIQIARHLQSLYPCLKETVPVMEKIAASQVQPTDKELWLAKLIPSSTEWLFIGEVHREENIRQSVRRFLTLLRQERPDQEIILMTEFLVDDIVWTPQLDQAAIPYYIKEYAPIWETAAANNIKVMGLEKMEMISAHVGRLWGPKNGPDRDFVLFPGSMEGVVIRNQTWVETLKKCREQHPNALIIVYAGVGHVRYNLPYSLSKLMNEKNMFVVSFYPDKDIEKTSAAESWYSQDWRVDPLEEMYRDAFFPQPALYWKDPALAELAGYNARLKVPQKSD